MLKTASWFWLTLYNNYFLDRNTFLFQFSKAALFETHCFDGKIRSWKSNFWKDFIPLWLVQIGLNLSKVVQTCPNWFKLVQSGSNLSKLVQSWFKLAQVNICQKLSFLSQYDDRLFIELRVQYMKIPNSEHIVCKNCFFVFVLTFRKIYVHNMFWAWNFHVGNS